MITKEGSSYSEMYVCWDSEHDSFAENCVVDFMVGCINDNRKLCKIETRKCENAWNVLFYDFKLQL